MKISILKNIKNLFHLFIKGQWWIGFDNWKGKPKFGFFLSYYDGYIFSFHLLSFYIEVY